MKQKFTFKMLLAVMLMAFCGTGAWAQTTDVLTATNLKLGGSYATITQDANAGLLATYTGNAMKHSSGAIQLRSKSNSGIVTTVSDAKALSVTVDWNTATDNARTLDIYGQNTPFASSADLYGKATKIGSIDHSKSETTFTITGDYKYIGVRSKSSALYLNSISIEWEKASSPVDPTKQDQTLSFGQTTAFEITEGETFTAPDLKGAKTAVTYESSNPAVATVDASGNVTLAGATGTTNITANAAEDATYNAASASYTLTVNAKAKNVANIAEFLKVTDGAVYTFTNPVIAIHQYGSDVWVKDATGYINVHGNISQKYNLGDEIPAGFSGALSEFKGVQQIGSPAGFQAASKTGIEVLPEEMQVANITTTDINKYVILKGVTFSSGKITDGTNSIAFFDKFKLGKFPTDGAAYDVTGIVNHFNSLQILPISFTKVVDASKQIQTLSFDQAEYVLNLGETLTAAVKGAKTAVTYSSSNEKVATVDANGVVKTLAAGTTTISAKAVATAEYNAGYASYELTVNPVITGETLPYKQVGGFADLGANFFIDGLNKKDYGSAEANLKFDTTNDNLTMVLADAPATLSYFVRWNGSGTFGQFVVETSVDGKVYTPFMTYDNASFAAGNDINEVHLALDENVRYIRWNYVTKVDGNIGIGSIMVTKKGDVLATPFEMSDAQFATYYSDQAFALPEGLTANFVTVVDQIAKLTPMYNAGDVVPANTPVLFTGAAGSHNLYTTNVSIKASKAKNALQGTLTDDVINAAAGNKLYILANDPVKGIGFYFQGAAGDGSSVSGLANKAYLQVDAAKAPVKGFSLNGEATGIEGVEATEGQAVIYTLSGVRVNADVNNLPKGLYIINGKKVLVK